MNSLTLVILCVGLVSVGARQYDNVTDLTSLQLSMFRHRHPKPIGILTEGPGAPVDLREITGINSDFASKEHMLETILHLDHENIPERIVHAKGGGAFGYFEVTHDVSKYIASDVFNGIGKKTPMAIRMSTVVQRMGGIDAVRETKGFAMKFYTKEGNLDLLNLNFPVYFYRDPIDFVGFAHSFARNHKTFVVDFNARFDFIVNRPDSLHAILWLVSDYGLPDGYRKMDAFPIHTYQVYNKHGDRFLVKFNFRTNQGLANLTDAQARGLDQDYFNRDLYSAIERGDYPSWRLELFVIPEEAISHLNYDPYEVTKIWEPGTYKVVQVGRVVLNKNPDNYIRDVEQSAYNPTNLVPGIVGAYDALFPSRRVAYRDAQNYRLGINHEKIQINQPFYAKTYDRNGVPPVLDNMGDAPNYYPNSFNGPEPYIDEARPSDYTQLIERNAVDLQNPADFLERYVTDEGHRNRLAFTTATLLETVYPETVKKTIRLIGLVCPDLAKRIKIALRRIKMGGSQ